MKYEHFFPTPDTESWNITVVSQAKNNQYHHVLCHSLTQNHTRLNKRLSQASSKS